jgi:hypothetical protein
VAPAAFAAGFVLPGLSSNLLSLMAAMMMRDNSEFRAWRNVLSRLL